MRRGRGQHAIRCFLMTGFRSGVLVISLIAPALITVHRPVPARDGYIPAIPLSLSQYPENPVNEKTGQQGNCAKRCQ